MALNENAQWWVEELRSGKYKQTDETLQNGGGFCCLGVACVLYEQDTGGSLPKNVNGSYAGTTLTFAFDKVRKWMGLKDNEGHFISEEGIVERLTALNDSGEYDFEDLADIIESEPQGLFL